MPTERSTGTDPAAVLNLMRLVSPALPVGTYAYSQGLEQACELGWTHDEDSVYEWVYGVMSHSLANLDVPVMLRMHEAWQNDDQESVIQWSEFLLANRESHELKKEDMETGRSLARLLGSLDVKHARDWQRASHTSYAGMFSLAAVSWNITAQNSAYGYLWSWAENQVAAALKLLPLGQTAGQKILGRIIPRLTECANDGLSLMEDEIGAMTAGLAIASARHEMQYSRLFRS